MREGHDGGELFAVTVETDPALDISEPRLVLGT